MSSGSTWGGELLNKDRDQWFVFSDILRKLTSDLLIGLFPMKHTKKRTVKMKNLSSKGIVLHHCFLTKSNIIVVECMLLLDAVKPCNT